MVTMVRRCIQVISLVLVVGAWGMEPTVSKSHTLAIDSEGPPVHKAVVKNLGVGGAVREIGDGFVAVVSAGAASGYPFYPFPLADEVEVSGADVHGKVEAVYAAIAYPLILLCLVGVFFMSIPYGWHAVALIEGFLIAMVAIRLQLRDIYSRGFVYPVTLTVFHLTISSVVATVCFAMKDEGAKVEFRKRWRPVLMISACIGLSILLNNVSFMYISTALNSVIAASGLIVQILILQVIGGVRFPYASYMVVSIAAFGAALSAVAGSTARLGSASMSAIAAFGAGLAMASLVARGVRGLYQQKMMDAKSISNDELTKDIHPLQLLSWTGAIGALFLIPVMLSVEGAAPLANLRGASLGLVVALLGSCCTATLVNVGSLYATKHLGAAGMANIGQLHHVLVPLLAAPMARKVVSSQQWVGILLIMLGVYMFEMKRKEIQNADGLPVYANKHVHHLTLPEEDREPRHAKYASRYSRRLSEVHKENMSWAEVRSLASILSQDEPALQAALAGILTDSDGNESTASSDIEEGFSDLAASSEDTASPVHGGQDDQGFHGVNAEVDPIVDVSSGSDSRQIRKVEPLEQERSGEEGTRITKDRSNTEVEVRIDPSYFKEAVQEQVSPPVVSSRFRRPSPAGSPMVSWAQQASQHYGFDNPMIDLQMSGGQARSWGDY